MQTIKDEHEHELAGGSDNGNTCKESCGAFICDGRKQRGPYRDHGILVSEAAR